MNESQRLKYFTDWNYLCRLNQWRMRGGRLDRSFARPERSPWHAAVWKCAREISLAQHSLVTPDILRKAVHLWKLGATISSKDLKSNSDIDRVFNGFRLLINPEDLSAIEDHRLYEAFDAAKNEIARCRQQHIPCAVELPDDPGERRRHLNFINRVPLAYVKHVVKSEISYFGTEEYSRLPLEKLRALTTTLKNRRVAYHQPAPQTVEEPF